MREAALLAGCVLGGRRWPSNVCQ